MHAAQASAPSWSLTNWVRSLFYELPRGPQAGLLATEAASYAAFEHPSGQALGGCRRAGQARTTFEMAKLQPAGLTAAAAEASSAGATAGLFERATFHCLPASVAGLVCGSPCCCWPGPWLCREAASIERPDFNPSRWSWLGLKSPSCV